MISMLTLDEGGKGGGKGWAGLGWVGHCVIWINEMLCNDGNYKYFRFLFFFQFFLLRFLLPVSLE